MSGTTKTVAEKLREKPKERSLECWLAESVFGIVCDHCNTCYNKTTNALADMIEAEQAERTQMDHDGVDVDALLKVADDLASLGELAIDENDACVPFADLALWVSAIRDAVKGANPSKSTGLNASKPMPFPEQLTHRKPDTLESVVSEMVENWYGDDVIDLPSYFNRLRKLMGGE